MKRRRTAEAPLVPARPTRGLRVILTEGSPVEVRQCEFCRGRIVLCELDSGAIVGVDVDRTSKGTLVLYTEVIAGLDELVGGYRVKTASPEVRAYLGGNLWALHTCPADGGAP